MWLDIRKASFHAHNSKLDAFPVTFSMVPFEVSDVQYHEYLGGLLMAPAISPEKQTTSCNSPDNWLMSQAMDLAALCDIWSWKSTNACHQVVFMVYLAFSSHAVAPQQLPPP